MAQAVISVQDLHGDSPPGYSYKTSMGTVPQAIPQTIIKSTCSNFQNLRLVLDTTQIYAENLLVTELSP